MCSLRLQICLCWCTFPKPSLIPCHGTRLPKGRWIDTAVEQSTKVPFLSRTWAFLTKAKTRDHDRRLMTQGPLQLPACLSTLGLASLLTLSWSCSAIDSLTSLSPAAPGLAPACVFFQGLVNQPKLIVLLFYL